MAYPSPSLPKQTKGKRLNELLKEQQEPFSLDAYLLERGYSSKKLNSKGVKRASKFSEILRTVIDKVVSDKSKPKVSRRKIQDRKLDGGSMHGRKTQHAGELDHLSTGSSGASSSGSEREKSQAYKLHSLRNQAIDTSRHQWEFVEDSKQGSPVSVLDELPTDGASPLHSRQVRLGLRTTSFSQQKAVTEEMIFSASMSDLLMRSGGTSSQYGKNKRVIVQTKQLLFDCVQEVLETHKRERRKKNVYGLTGTEEIGKMIGEQLFVWGKISGNVENITRLIHSDLLDSIVEWNDLQLKTRGIGMEIGNAILEEITDEIVTDIIDSFVIKGC